MLQVHEIDDDRRLGELTPEWDDLLGRCSHAGIFQTPEWLLTCRRFFGRGSRLTALAVRDGERLVGLAPLEIARMYGSPLRRLRFIGTGRSDYLDIIADDRSNEDVLQAIFTWLTEHQSRWDVIDLQEIPEDECGSMGVWGYGCPGTPIPPYSHTPTLSHSLLPQELCPYMPLAPTWEETIAGIGKKTRYNLGYYERLMRRRFEVEIGLLDSGQLNEGLEALFRLHTERWKKRWLPGVLSGDHTRAFHRELASRFLERGRLRFHALRLDGEIKAVLYCLAYKSRTYYYIGGFDPELAKYSLGTVLTGHAIRHAVEEGCTEFDFLRGDEKYKTLWTDRARMNGRLIIGKRGMRSAVSSGVCRLEMKIERAAKNWLHHRFSGK